MIPAKLRRVQCSDPHKQRLTSRDFVLVGDSESPDVDFVIQQMKHLILVDRPNLDITESADPLLVELGWSDWLDADCKDWLLYHLPTDDSLKVVARNSEKYWADSVLLVRGLPAVARWVSPGGNLSNALFRFPKDATIEKRRIMFLKMMYWIRY